MNKIYNNLKNNILYYLIYLLFTIEFMINIQSKYITGDESFTYNMIHHSFINIINLTAQDVHPFLYYFISKLFTYNITDMYLQIHILRIVSALPYLILLIIGNTYIRNKYSKFTSNIFMICIISMPLLIDNMYTIRMYGWATLFTTVVYLLFMVAYKYNNFYIFIFISLFSILSAYTHYYALITVFILYALFLILFVIKKKEIKYLIISIIINIIIYLPWLNTLLTQTKDVSTTFWTSKLTLDTVIHILFGFISPVYKLSLFYVLPFLFFILLISLILNRNIRITNLSFIGILTPFLLILIGSLFSFIIGRAIIMVRYITPSIGIFWLSISIIIDDLGYRNKILKYILVFLTLMISILSYTITNKNTINNTEKFNKTLMVYKNIPSNSAILYDDAEIMSSMSSYLRNNYLLDYSNNVYKKTLSNYVQKNNLNLPLYKNVFYVKSDRNNNILINQFNNKYINNMKHYKYIYLPTDYNNSINIYKIK